MLRRGPLFAPGRGWACSNVGYLLLRLMIERVAGWSLREALRRLVVDPLGPRQTFVAESLADAAALTPGHSALLSEDGSLTDIRRRYDAGWVSHGVGASTAMELALFLDALFRGNLFAADSLAEMLEPVDVLATHPCFRRAAYGLGVMIDPES